MGPKPQANHRQYLEALARMTPGERLEKACALSDYARELLRTGLKERFPKATQEELTRLVRRQVERCSNSNW